MPISFRSPSNLLFVPVALGLLLGVANTAAAEVAISAGGGVFEPWEGDTGYEVNGSVLVSLGLTGKWRLGGEFSFRQFESEFFGVDDVDVDSYRISFVVHRRFRMVPIVTPYVGGRISVAINSIDDDEIEAAKPNVDANSIGSGAGVAGIVGLDWPVGDHFTFYTEVSIGVDVQITDDGSYDVENIGGVSGVGGIRLHF